MRHSADLPDSLVGVAGWLRQILTNLGGNAIKLTERGEVVLSAARIDTPSGVGDRATVRDTGIGIAKAKHASIFEAFAQADSTTTRRFGGTARIVFVGPNGVRSGGRGATGNSQGSPSEWVWNGKSRFNPELSTIIAAWPTLPVPLRRAMLARIESVG